jgi:hypothetical protein
LAQDAAVLVREQKLKNPGGTTGSRLIQDHVSVNSLRRPGGIFKGAHPNPGNVFLQTSHKTVIRRGCDFFDFLLWPTQPECSSTSHQTVILSEAPREFIA